MKLYQNVEFWRAFYKGAGWVAGMWSTAVVFVCGGMLGNWILSLL